jgi:hypothetical protein
MPKLKTGHGLFRSTRENYGDAAIGYVELKERHRNLQLKDGYVQNTAYGAKRTVLKLCWTNTRKKL